MWILGRRGHGEGSIRQRANGRWEARVTVGYGPNGRQIRRSYYADTRTAAQQRLTKALSELQQGLPLADERQTVGAFLERWLEDCHRTKVRPSTYVRSAQIMRDHLAPHIGRIRLAKLTPADVQRLVNSLHASGLSAKSVANIHGVLRSALNQAVRWGDLARNVATLVSLPRDPVSEIEPFTPEEAVAFLEAIRGDRLETVFTVILALGLRRGEALGLRWDDVDLENGTLTVRRSLRRQDGRLTLVEPKTTRGRRTLVLPQFALTSLQGHRKRQVQERLLAGAGWTDTDFVFTSTVGTAIDPDNLSHRFKRILEKAGLRPQRLHDLRHCAATLMLIQNVPARVVQEILGHAHVSTTLGIYSHVIPSLKRDAADRVDNLLAPRETPSTDAAGAVAQ